MRLLASVVLTACALLVASVATATTPGVRLASQHSTPAVTITPKMPYVDDSVTVHIHAKTPLPAGQVYTVYVDALDGRFGDGYSHLVVKHTHNATIVINPSDDPLGGTEWEQGKGTVLVARGVAGSNPKTAKSVGFVNFRFIAKP